MHTASDTVVDSNASKPLETKPCPSCHAWYASPQRKSRRQTASRYHHRQVSSQTFTSNIHAKTRMYQQEHGSCSLTTWNALSHYSITLLLNLRPKANTLRRILSKHVKTHDASAVIRGMPAHGENLVAKQLQGIITGRFLHKRSQAKFTQRLECINKSTGAAV